MIFVNGEVVSQVPRFSVRDVEVATAVVDIEEVESYRREHGVLPPFGDLTSPRVEVACNLYRPTLVTPWPAHRPPTIRGPKIHSLEEEIAMAPSCYLWHYRR
jgi:NAD+ synthase (glutamine-hydrolysing)